VTIHRYRMKIVRFLLDHIDPIRLGGEQVKQYIIGINTTWEIEKAESIFFLKTPSKPPAIPHNFRLHSCDRLEK
jgi:hypothetical protein